MIRIACETCAVHRDAFLASCTENNCPMAFETSQRSRDTDASAGIIAVFGVVEEESSGSLHSL